VLISDGGGKTNSALRPITGADKEVARFAIGIAGRGSTLPGPRVEIVDLDGAPAAVAWAEGEPLMTMSLVVADGWSPRSSWCATPTSSPGST
jgi:RNA polymerase sigma-70 factor (ECF subfamily)